MNIPKTPIRLNIFPNFDNNNTQVTCLKRIAHKKNNKKWAKILNNNQITNNKPEIGTQLDELTLEATPTILEPVPAMESVECTFTSSSTKLITFDESLIRTNYCIYWSSSNNTPDARRIQNIDDTYTT